MRPNRATIALAISLSLASCGADSYEVETTNTGGVGSGGLSAGAQFLGSGFLPDPHQGGKAGRLRLVQLFRARLAHVYDRDPATGQRTLQFCDFPIDEKIKSDGVDYQLDWSHALQRDVVTILHRAGTPAWAAALAGLDAAAVAIPDAGATPVPPIPYVQRNAVLVARFDDLLDAATIDPRNVRVTTGATQPIPFEVRVVPDATHGAIADPLGTGTPKFFTTRVIIDMTVSEVEALATNPPVPINAIGLPPGGSGLEADVRLRIPTKLDPAGGQLTRLTNPVGGAVSPVGNGTTDPGAPTIDVLRLMRAGSAQAGDPAQGFLPDSSPPNLIAERVVRLRSATRTSDGDYSLTITELLPACALPLAAGDSLRVGSHLFELVAAPVFAPASPAAGARFLRARLWAGSPSAIPVGSQGLLGTAYEAVDPIACFLRFSVQPLSPPAQGVDPLSTVGLRFSEPLDPGRMVAMETLRIEKPAATLPFQKGVVTQLSTSPDGRTATITPTLPLAHSVGLTENYEVRIDSGAGGVADLAGLALVIAPPPAPFTLEPTAPGQSNSGLVWSYDKIDEDGDGFGELRGQFVYDLARGVLRPRPVTRFSSVADASQPVVSVMIPFTPGVQEPLNPLGSRLMTNYRYYDLGLGLLDESAHNLDVEGLAWAPNGGQVVLDAFGEFRMAMSHGGLLPDEVVSQFTLLPKYPQSGLVGTFATNLLDPAADPLTVVHPKSDGYPVSPVDLFVASTGTKMMPWPMNRGVPIEQMRRYTWRDTSLTTVGGPNGVGVDTEIHALVTTGQPPVTSYVAGAVPTIGLPLLTEFRCYADPGALGLNSFRVNLAINSSARPFFRAFSAGGIAAGGVPVVVDPDNAPTATGGFIPSTGAPYPGLDNVFYLGQADFVTRVSRLHSVWFNTRASSPTYAGVAIAPQLGAQPGGTDLRVAWRGATALAGSGSSDPAQYDAYGDPIPSASFAPTYSLGTSAIWEEDPGRFDGAQWMQYRVSFVSNPATGQSPELDALGLAFRQ